MKNDQLSKMEMCEIFFGNILKSYTLTEDIPIIDEKLVKEQIPLPEDGDNITDEIVALFLACFLVYKYRTGNTDMTQLGFTHILQTLICNGATKMDKQID